MNYVIKHDRCPKCAENGRDRGGNNLAVYSDGHSFCYAGHGVVDFGSKITAFNNKYKEIEELHKYDLTLPEDSDIVYPDRCLKWMSQYGLDKNDLFSNNILWSEQKQRLLFPIYDNNGLVAWQGRWFGEGNHAKWFTKGNVKDLFHILGKSDILVLVEDIVSAIVVGKVFSAMPLFGCFVGKDRFKRLYSLYGKEIEVCVWLDPDKRKEAISETKLGSLYGLRTRTIFSDVDPKELTTEQIKEKLND